MGSHCKSLLCWNRNSCPRAFAAIANSGLARGLPVLKNLSEAGWLDVLELRRAGWQPGGVL